MKEVENQDFTTVIGYVFQSFETDWNTSSSPFVTYVEQFTHLESYPFLTREVRTNVRRTNQEKGIGRKVKVARKKGRERRKRKGTRTRIIKVSAFSPSSSASTLLFSHSPTDSREADSFFLACFGSSLSFLPSCSITRIQIRI